MLKIEESHLDPSQLSDDDILEIACDVVDYFAARYNLPFSDSEQCVMAMALKRAAHEIGIPLEP